MEILLILGDTFNKIASLAETFSYYTVFIRENLFALGSKPEIDFQRSRVPKLLRYFENPTRSLFAAFWHLNTLENLA